MRSRSMPGWLVVRLLLLVLACGLPAPTALARTPGQAASEPVVVRVPVGTATPQVDDQRPGASDQGQPFNTAFVANLYQNASAVREGEADDVPVTPSSAAEGFSRESWKLAILPDTQNYAMDVPGLFHLQTDWLLRNAERLDIRYVLHLGDITNNNNALQWERARAAMSRLDGTIPYALVGGNHDYGPNGNASTRDTLLNEYFPFEDLSRYEGFGGAMEPGKLDNTYHLFEAGGRKWIILALEWGPRDETVAWANEVMSRHPDHVGILITHAYLFHNDRRYDHNDTEHPQTWNPHNYPTPGGVNDGEELWQKLVRRHNFAFVFNGHVLGDGTGYLSSENDLGGITHQMLSNYQMRPLGGEAYLRVLEFLPDDRTVRVRSYTPLFDRFMVEADQSFDLTLKLAEGRGE